MFLFLKPRSIEPICKNSLFSFHPVGKAAALIICETFQ